MHLVYVKTKVIIEKGKLHKSKNVAFEDFINPKLDFASVKKIMFVKIKSIH